MPIKPHRPRVRILTLVGTALLLVGHTSRAAAQDPNNEQQVSSPVPDSAATEPREVGIGLFIADLVEIAGADQSFFADVFMEATWHAPELQSPSEGIRTLDLEDVWHPTLVIVNSRGASPGLPEQVSVAPDGAVSYLQRYTGTFAAPMDLREFPLDSQTLSVWVVAVQRAHDPVVVAPRPEMTLIRDRLSISDWTIGEPVLRDQDFLATPDGRSTSGVALVAEATRDVNYYIIQVLIPLAAVVMMAWAVFWVDPGTVPVRVSVVVTTMLTLIAYRFMLANLVPRLSYLTRLDWFMLGATLLLMTTLFVMAGTSYLVTRERRDIVAKIDRVGRVAYPLVFVSYSMFVWLR